MGQRLEGDRGTQLAVRPEGALQAPPLLLPLPLLKSCTHLSLFLSLSLSDPGFSPSTLYCGSPGLGSSASCFGDSLALCSLLYTQKGFLNPFPWEKSSFCST